MNDPVNDFRIRKKVLVKTPELAALHRELVMSGQITETEFWEGREVRDQPIFVWDVSYLTFSRVLASPTRAGRFRLSEEGQTRSTG